MVDLTKQKRYINKKYLAAARNQSCTARLKGCSYNNETTVACHSPFAKSGMGQKASDTEIAFLDDHCHSVLDRRIPSEYTREELEAEFKSARKLTHIKLNEMGLMPFDEIGVIK